MKAAIEDVTSWCRARAWTARPALRACGAAAAIAVALTSGATAQERRAISPDALITQRAMAVLEREGSLSAADISVETLEGVVHLRGSAGSVADIERAARLVGGTYGVRGVINSVRVARRPFRV